MLEQSMPIIETWLGRHSHLCGDEISFADLLAFHEFVSHEAGAIIPADEWARFPRIRAWFERLQERPQARALVALMQELRALGAREVTLVTRPGPR